MLSSMWFGKRGALHQPGKNAVALSTGITRWSHPTVSPYVAVCK